MKINKYIFIAFLVAFAGNAQEKKRKVDFMKDYNIFGVHRSFVGDEHLMKSSLKNSSFGIGADLGIVHFYNFTFGFSGEIGRFKVEELKMLGNFNTLNLTVLGAYLQYKIYLDDDFIAPEIGYFNETIVMKSYGKESSIDGSSFSMGLKFQKQVSENIALFIGGRYQVTRFDIETAPYLKDFYRKNNFLALRLGINFK